MTKSLKDTIKEALVENSAEEKKEPEKKPRKVVSLTSRTKKTTNGKSAWHNIINGNSNIVGNNNHVIVTEKVVKKTIIETKPGEEHITDEQVALLKSLASEIVYLSKNSGTKSYTYGAVYQQLFLHLSKPKKRATIGKVRLIPLHLFDHSERFLRQWIGSLTAAPKGPLSEEEWRKKKYAYIKLNLKKYDWEERFGAYVLESFGTKSIKNLDNDELEKAYRKVSSWKSAL